VFSDKFQVKTLKFVPAVNKAVGEILDNSWDELIQYKRSDKKITIVADPEIGHFIISDNGRGIPIDIHETGKYTPEVALVSLRAGRNFSDDKEAGVIGMNGVGSSCVVACSTKFEVTIHRDNKKYTQLIENGSSVIHPPKIVRKTGVSTGTTIEFQLDPEVFKNVELPYDLVRNRAKELAFNNPDIAVEFNGEDFQYKKGFEEILKTVSNSYFKMSGPEGDFYIVLDLHYGIDEQMFTWVNSSLLFDGGICNTQFMNAFSDKVIESLESAAKKQKCVVTRNDIKRDLMIFGVLKIANPEYDAQSKTRLTGPNMRNSFIKMIETAWPSFQRKNKAWLELVLERANRRHHFKADDKAKKDHEKSINKKVPGLLDATSKDRSKCKLLICEGLSASAQICEVRDPATIGSYALTGKINNVYGCSIAEVLGMGKLKDMLAAIGLVPGKKAVKANLNFGEIIIATDADVDGGNIFNLLTNCYYQFWPELFDAKNEPVVYRLIAPNVVASKGNIRKHFVTREEYEKKKDTLKGYTIEYMKGLGSMHKEDWEIILANPKQYQMPIQDDGRLKDALRLMFSPDIDARKEWLQQDE
jgi:DNA gyrase subunit B